jgi:hypothetical protein
MLGAALSVVSVPSVPTVSLPSQPETRGQKPTPPPTRGTAAISGVVVDGFTNQPIAGAFVTIGSSVRGVVPTPSRLATDGQGRFVFARLPAGTYSVSAAKLGYGLGRYGQIDPGATAPGRPIRLAEGQWFADARIVIWRPGAISGTITDEAGEPVVGTPVRVLAQVMIAGRQQLAAGSAARTDDRGRYRIAGLAKGRYVVMVPSVQAAVPADAAAQLDDPAITIDPANRLIVGGYVTPPPPSRAGWVYPITFFPAVRTIADATSIDLDHGEDRANIDVQLAPVRSVSVSGLVQGPAGAEPGGMTLRLLPAGSETLGFGSETATALVAPNGAFTLLNVPAGTYAIVVSRSTMEYRTGEGIVTYPSSTVAMPRPPGHVADSGFSTVGPAGGPRFAFSHEAGTREYSARMTLTVGDQELTGIVVPLLRAVTISGRIIWNGPSSAGAERGMAGIPVNAEPANGDALLGLPTGWSVRGDVMRFRVEGLLPGGAYLLRPAGVVKSIEWQGRDYTDRPFDTFAGRDIENVVITLTTEAIRLTGTVRDATGALASNGAVITFPTDKSLWSGNGLRPFRIRSIRVLPAGTFAISSLPAGEYFVVAVDESLANAWQDPRFLEAASGAASRVTLAWGEAKNVDLSIRSIKVR